ncbi:MAG: hypothetical protein ABII01_05140 [Candidatus Woesearchaeota archaeon]
MFTYDTNIISQLRTMLDERTVLYKDLNKEHLRAIGIRQEDISKSFFPVSIEPGTSSRSEWIFYVDPLRVSQISMEYLNPDLDLGHDYDLIMPSRTFRAGILTRYKPKWIFSKRPARPNKIVGEQAYLFESYNSGFDFNPDLFRIGKDQRVLPLYGRFVWLEEMLEDTVKTGRDSQVGGK